MEEGKYPLEKKELIAKLIKLINDAENIDSLFIVATKKDNAKTIYEIENKIKPEFLIASAFGTPEKLIHSICVSRNAERNIELILDCSQRMKNFVK